MAARPTTRRATTEPAEPPVRSPVRDFTGGGTSHVIEWDVRPAYDFMFSLTDEAGATDDLPAEDRAWLKDARTNLGEVAKVQLDRLCENDLAVHLAAFVVERRELRNADAVVAAIEAAGPGPVLRSIFSEAILAEPANGPLLERVIAGDTGALPVLEQTLPEWKRAERLDVLRDPAAAMRDIVTLLRAWAERFRPIEDRISAILARDYDLRAADRAAYSGPDLIERTTGGVRWLPEPGVRRVILAPSYFSRPYNYLLAGADWRFFGYPVADDVLDNVDPLAPPATVLRLHRALGDETRLRILKLLATKDLYLTEIAQHLELSKPTIKHHLSQLRVAGLVTVVESGQVMYYTLRRDRLDDASTEIKSFLVG
ncbi:MAG: metalloregulator ArsR/SmtB family transcription factor [Chloroflexi bacterium]|nr:metalloregulator ArsR/SmtB family transcription factor [Chloroflexota bacterium]